MLLIQSKEQKYFGVTLVNEPSQSDYEYLIKWLKQGNEGAENCFCSLSSAEKLIFFEVNKHTKFKPRFEMGCWQSASHGSQYLLELKEVSTSKRFENFIDFAHEFIKQLVRKPDGAH